MKKGVKEVKSDFKEVEEGKSSKDIKMDPLVILSK